MHILSHEKMVRLLNDPCCKTGLSQNEIMITHPPSCENRCNVHVHDVS
jgi:hypothetical protein